MLFEVGGVGTTDKIGASELFSRELWLEDTRLGLLEFKVDGPHAEATILANRHELESVVASWRAHQNLVLGPQAVSGHFLLCDDGLAGLDVPGLSLIHI